MSIETMTKLATYTVGAGGVASYTFSNIPQTYTDLKIVLSTRDDRGAVGTDLMMYFNGSETSLTQRRLYANGSSPYSSGDSTGKTTIESGGTAKASTFGNAEVYIPNYSGNMYKSWSTNGLSENDTSLAYQQLNAGIWSNSAPITSITFYPLSANFVQYSTFTLYGIKAYRTVTSFIQPFSGGYLYAPLPGKGGYLFGGVEGGSAISSIKKLLFASETYGVLTSTTPAAVTGSAGSANSGVAGYSYGGVVGGSTSNTISKLTFASAAVSTLSATITTVTQYGASFSDSGTAGYKASGFDGSSTFLSGVDKLLYSTEVKSATGSNMAAVYCVNAAGFSNKGSAGYVTDGYSWSLNFIGNVYKYAFSTGTVSSPTSYVDAQYNVVSFADEGVAGYSAGGGDNMLNSIAKMPFSTDTMSNTGYTLSAGKDWGFGLSNIGTAGYFASGRSSRTDTDRISFSTGVRTTISPTITYRYGGASISDNGVF